MFVPAEMSEVDIFVLENDILNVAQTVAQMGVMHLLDVNALGKWAEGVGTEWAGRVSAYTNQERRVLELLGKLGIEERQEGCDGQLNPGEDVTIIERRLHDVEDKTRALVERGTALQEQMEHWELITHSMELLAPLSVSITDLRQLAFLHMVVGTIPAENLARIEASLFRIPFSIIPVYRYGGRVLVFAFCSQEHAPILDRALESAFLDPLLLPQEFSGTAQDVLDQVRRALIRDRAALDESKQALSKVAAEFEGLLLSSLTRIRGDRAIAEAMAHFGHRGRVYLIAGWVPKDRVQELREAVESETEGRVTFEENSPYAPGDHAIPTLLRNNWLFKPIEGIVSTYGRPGYREIDPTPLVAITFVLMFGSMFGDLGHGLFLIAVGALLLSKIVPSMAKMAPIGIILVACGLSSSVFGVLYGSMFGLEDLIHPLWLKPMKDIPSLLIASIILGVTILNIGFACSLISAARQGVFKEAIFDKNGILGMVLYWSFLAMALFAALGHNGIPGWLFGVSAVLLMALFFAKPLARFFEHKRPLMEGGFVEFSIEAFFELFEALISYISNTLSYVRLGAFAVAHAGLMMVIFMLADLVGTGGGLTAVIRVVFIALGNLFVIGFEGLIVGIQTLRLEYYELFSKFYEGEGIEFKPLTLPSLECPTPASVQERS